MTCALWPAPPLPQWKVGPNYVGYGYQRETLHGVDVWRAPLWVPKTPGGLKRVLHLLSFAANVGPLMLRQVFLVA